ncbi:hypothetical protein C8J57DRAFT_1531299 [Mycena rebaudengoi]|nr:hypothetical protein C8J57DRAFT_1531299 [Mycena rebaudengoi]
MSFVSANTSPDLEPRLPPDLERRIFELAAHSHRHVIFPLLQVARRTFIWLEPLLYRVVVWDETHPTEEQVRKAYAPLKALHSKPPHFVRTAVRHVIIHSRSHTNHPNMDMDGLLLRCTGGISFVAGGAYVTPRLLPILEQIQVQRLSIHLKTLFQGRIVDLQHPLFSSVTHLYLFDSSSVQQPFYLQLSLLTALTHLRVPEHVPYDALSANLAECRSLRVVVAVSDSHRFRNPPVTDSRFVTLLMHDSWSGFKRGALSGMDFWTRAEEFIASKARGEIEGHSSSHI